MIQLLYLNQHFIDNTLTHLEIIETHVSRKRARIWVLIISYRINANRQKKTRPTRKSQLDGRVWIRVGWLWCQCSFTGCPKNMVEGPRLSPGWSRHSCEDKLNQTLSTSITSNWGCVLCAPCWRPFELPPSTARSVRYKGSQSALTTQSSPITTTTKKSMQDNLHPIIITTGNITHYYHHSNNHHNRLNYIVSRQKKKNSHQHLKSSEK